MGLASGGLKVVCQWKNLNQPIPKLTNDQYGKHEQRLTYLICHFIKHVVIP